MDLQEPEKEQTPCARCGSCCRTNMMAYVTAEDRAAWRARGRQDILDMVDEGTAIWAGDRIISRYDGSSRSACPFL